MTMQRGLLWWVSHHRNHHRSTDTVKDCHSPVAHGLYRAHMGWVWNCFDYDPKLVKDLMRYPELIWINRFYILPAIITIIVIFILGEWLGTDSTTTISGGQFVTWGYLVPMAVCLHATYAINSVCHLWGYRRYETSDNSKNNLLIALLMLGEGWHNNHHKFPYSANMGISRYEIDIGYLLLKFLGVMGIIWNIKTYEKSDIGK
ncbi:MAG: acyl-CoA desaturase [Ectothiorhodospiraceae bacterium]|nr:acyl-CoA desaturase [Ectothiorhodospiraceae bacterium]